ncbi:MULTISPECIES: RNA polymerase sigma factor [Aestuariimicrobium]|uniref:RNA polymerase sigma factor n=1 Tax=Aestuariimicrobium TaxID=396388 RepID=UPI0003B32338|nr:MULTISPECIES: sigma-70 family RNA polymerase sigma factor [Aestuariimicrobium]CAI9404072.1 hypothetical protein AESSP_01134 [Aestuariimicrobium sp. T2.26MG-19.2B]
MTDLVRAALEVALRRDRPQIVATLLRATSDWELAEDCLQDAAERALVSWGRQGVPESPAAWLTTVARRRALDVIRRRTAEARALARAQVVEERSPALADDGGGYADDRLRLLFTCCHPDIAIGDRVALTLKTVNGLSTRELARLFLVQEQTMSQRLRRTRARISRDGLLLAVPPVDDLDDRIDAVLAVIHLIFTEAHDSTEGSGLRDVLADEALVLAQLTAWLMPLDPEVHGLRALLLLQHARRPARTGTDGAFIPLDEQDRSLWDRPMVVAGIESLERSRELSATSGEPAGPYRAQAEIAVVHSTSPTPQLTDWATILVWYDALLQATGSPVVALNRAIALGMRDGPPAGLVALERVAADPHLVGSPQVALARAELLRRAGDHQAALACHREALQLARTDGARLHIERRLHELGEVPATKGIGALQ